MNTYTKDELETLILQEKLSYEAIGRLYNVTGAAIKKAAKKLGIDLPVRKQFSSNVNFSHPKKSKVYALSDEQFSEIISNSIGWKQIDLALGYAGIASSNVHQQIKERCSMLGMELKLEKTFPNIN